jgi:hypothetical protein
VIDQRRKKITRKRAEHEDVAVREIDEAKDAVNHRVAESDQRVNGAERQAINQLLGELVDRV